MEVGERVLWRKQESEKKEQDGKGEEEIEISENVRKWENFYRDERSM